MDFFGTVLTFFKTGGAFMYPIAMVMVLGLAIAVERWLFLSLIHISEPTRPY